MNLTTIHMRVLQTGVKFYRAAKSDFCLRHLCLSICWYICMEQLGYRLANFCEFFVGASTQICREIQVLLKSEQKMADYKFVLV